MQGLLFIKRWITYKNFEVVVCSQLWKYTWRSINLLIFLIPILKYFQKVKQSLSWDCKRVNSKMAIRIYNGTLKSFVWKCDQVFKLDTKFKIYTKVTCTFLLQKNTKEWSELYTFEPRKTTISYAILIR